jgi:phosphatidylglycerophosphate synthase
MIDRFIYEALAPFYRRIAGPFITLGVTANQLTFAGFLVGISAVPLLASNHYRLALLAILLNRFLDGLDGAVARATSVTDRGAFLDIALDFLFYGAIPLGFSLADPAGNAQAAAVLLFSFIGTGSSFLAASVIAGKRNMTAPQFRKGIFFTTGLMEGFETALFFALMCVLPSHFPIIAYVFAALCLLTTLLRLLNGWRIFA